MQNITEILRVGVGEIFRNSNTKINEDLTNSMRIAKIIKKSLNYFNNHYKSYRFSKNKKNRWKSLKSTKINKKTFKSVENRKNQ